MSELLKSRLARYDLTLAQAMANIRRQFPSYSDEKVLSELEVWAALDECFQNLKLIGMEHE